MLLYSSSSHDDNNSNNNNSNNNTNQRKCNGNHKLIPFVETASISTQQHNDSDNESSSTNNNNHHNKHTVASNNTRRQSSSDVRLRSSPSSTQQQRGQQQQQNYRCDDEQPKHSTTVTVNTLSFGSNHSKSRSNRLNNHHHRNNNNNCNNGSSFEQNVSHPSILPKVRVTTPILFSSKYVFSFFSILLIMGSMFSVLLQTKYYAEIVVSMNVTELNHINRPVVPLPTSSITRRPEAKETDSINKLQIPALQHFPRIIFLDIDGGTIDQSSNPQLKRIMDLEYNISHSNDNKWQPVQDIAGSTCIPKSDWQYKSYPNCNIVHEIDFAISSGNEINPGKSTTTSVSEDTLLLLGEGWFRTTWRLDRSIPTESEHKESNSNHVESVVLKTLRIEREFLSEYYELHRRDAVAMERLTGSQFVVDVYGFCGQSAVNELANFPIPGVQNLESFTKRMRGTSTSSTAAIQLRLAASIALGVADIHAAGEHDPIQSGHHTRNKQDAYMTHYDLNPRNIALFEGGRPKINDFNIAEFLRYDPQTNQTCGFPSRLHEPWWRAPEEMDLNATMNGRIINEKVDIFALGNILFHILTTHSPWGKMKKERMESVRIKLRHGEFPKIPDEFLKNKSGYIKAIVKAIQMCWVYDPNKRARASDVAHVLFQVIPQHNVKL